MPMSAELKNWVDQQIRENRVVVFLKGTRDFPMCGFSANAVNILRSAGVEFRDINILENEDLRQGMKEYSDWPTFPQIYLDGEFLGGSDILAEMYESGELQRKLQARTAG